MRGQHHTDRASPDACDVIRARERERVLRKLAARQHGILSRAQLLELGFSPAAIQRLLESGRLRPIHRGVYLVGPVVPPLGPEMAAVLACGNAAVLSHLSAAQLWALLPYKPKPQTPEVTVPARDPGTRPGIRIHRVRTLGPHETTTVKRIPITTVARTLLDLAVELRPRELERALAEALRRNLVSRRRLDALIARYPRRHGTPALRRLLENETQPALTRSEAEERLLDLIRRAELSAPEVNVRVGPFEVDFLWREQRLVVEVDGYAYHSDRKAFEDDRRRDAELVARGFRVVRVTWRQIAEAPVAALARIAAALALPG